MGRLLSKGTLMAELHRPGVTLARGAVRTEAGGLVAGGRSDHPEAGQVTASLRGVEVEEEVGDFPAVATEAPVALEAHREDREEMMIHGEVTSREEGTALQADPMNRRTAEMTILTSMTILMVTTIWAVEDEVLVGRS